MTKDRKLILLGDSAFAEIAYEYFTWDSPYEVVAFSVERAYLKRERLFDLPVVPFEELDRHYAPGEHSFYAALVYTQLNRLRARLYQAAKAKGFAPASYVSPRAFLWRNVQLGEHCFIFEGNVVQPFVKIGNNVVLWSGNHIGHHSTIGDHCFVSSHVVISGFCEVGPSCFFGVNAATGNNVKIGADCLLGAGATVVADVPADTLVRGNLSDLSKPLSARRYFKVRDEAA
jgi:sugar O-acyltransferase (sialic acid O-acetyltransferase NeuD family)